jgi:acyl-CoA thioesterase FadM
MSFFFRLWFVILRAWFGKRRSLHEPSRVYVRVWPNDLDLNIHMNNGRYLTLMDLGRMDLMLRTGAMKLWFGHGWQPMVALSTCRHFKALKCFQSFELRTRVLGWDEKWIYFEQRFLRGEQLHALAAVKALMVGPKGPVPTQELFMALNFHHEFPHSPALPDWVQSWLRAERQAIDSLKAEEAAASKAS